jgi:hypothetical protein
MGLRGKQSQKEANDTLFHELAHAVTEVVDTITDGKSMFKLGYQHQKDLHQQI